MHRSLHLVVRCLTNIALLVVVAMVTIPKAPAVSQDPTTPPDFSTLSSSLNYTPDTVESAATTMNVSTPPILICAPPCCHDTPTGRCACIKGCGY